MLQRVRRRQMRLLRGARALRGAAWLRGHMAVRSVSAGAVTCHQGSWGSFNHRWYPKMDGLHGKPYLLMDDNL